MEEYNYLWDSASPQLKEAIIDAETGKRISVSPTEMTKYQQISYLKSLLTNPIQDLNQLSDYDLQYFYGKLMAKAPDELKEILKIADSGVAFSIPADLIKLYEEIRYVQHLLQKRLSTPTPLGR